MSHGENEERFHECSSIGENENIPGTDEEKVEIEIDLGCGVVGTYNKEKIFRSKYMFTK